MTRRQRAFRTWLAVLTAVWVLANVPYPFTKFGVVMWYTAGFPWRYAVWDRSGKWETFDPAAFASDAAAWLGVAWLSWSRTQRGNANEAAAGPQNRPIG